MDAWLLPVALNVVLGVIAWLGKMALDDMRKNLDQHRLDLRNNQDAIQKVREEYLNKNDFKEFKSELYDRLDKNHEDVIRQIKAH